ncbi:hypothetical protein KQI52_00575 [bacterium]|nr:hypothetical protein [bacterium]
MRVDPRLEQFTALIEQQRMRQPSMTGNATRARSLTTTPALTSTKPVARVNSPFSDAAERARAAMAARNPALAAKLAQARQPLAVNRATATQANAAVSAGTSSSRAARPGTAPATHDLLAIPQRPAPAPGLGRSIDTYA